MRRPSKREWVLIALAVAAGIAVVVAAQQGGADDGPAVAEVVQKADRAGGKTPRAEGRGHEDLALAQTLTLDPASLQRGGAAAPADAFQKKSWYVPPPPPPVVYVPPPPPPPPTAPPLPFTFMGRYMESDKPVYFLTAGERLLMVHTGDVIDGTYRIEGVVANKLDITYLPLNIKQSVDIGGAG